MENLFNVEIRQDEDTNLCNCLKLAPSNKVTQHSILCPKPYLLTTPFDFLASIRDPCKFYSNEQTVPRISSANPFTQFTADEIEHDPGFERIDRFMSILNFIRSNVQGCTIFYMVTDDLLRHMFAQLLPVIVGDRRFNETPSKYFKYAQLKPVPVRSFITTARQIGKTTSVKQYCVCRLNSLETNFFVALSYIENKDGIIGHCIDPRTGQSGKNNIISVTVVADEAAVADAYATAFMVMDFADIIMIVSADDELDVFFIFENEFGKLESYASYNLEDIFMPLDKDSNQ